VAWSRSPRRGTESSPPCWFHIGPRLLLQLGEVCVGDGAEVRRIGLGPCGALPLSGAIRSFRSRRFASSPNLACPGERHRWVDAEGKELLFAFEAIGETPEPRPSAAPKAAIQRRRIAWSASRQRRGSSTWHRNRPLRPAGYHRGSATNKTTNTTRRVPESDVLSGTAPSLAKRPESWSFPPDQSVLPRGIGGREKCCRKR
jgi:hypothetical protein